MRIAIFIGILVLQVWAGSWDTSTKIAEGANAKAMFIDPKSGVIHIASCQEVSGTKDVYLFYKQIALNGTQTDGKQLEGVRGCTEVAIDGQEDGKHVLISFVGPRMSGEISCTEREPIGCLDLFFKESYDEGVTWTLSAPVPRDNMNDVVHRLHAQLIHVKESSRVWLVYMKNDTEQEYASLRYVVRPPGSTIFNKEEQLMAGEKMYPVLAYTTPKPGVQVLHLVWCEFVENKFLGYYSKSSDNGKSWSIPAAILKRDKGPPTMRLTTSRSAPGYIFLVFPDSQYGKWELRWSHDNGGTWSTDTVALNYYTYLSLALCSVTVKKQEIEMFALSEIADQGEFGAYSLGKSQYIKVETPFVMTDNKSGPVLACIPLAKKSVISVKALVTGGDSGKTLYFTSQEYAPINYSVD